MDNLIYDSGASVQRLIAQGFQMPIHFVAVGTNGAVVAGTFEASVYGQDPDCHITVPMSNPDGLAGPINIMYVDSKGESALFVLGSTVRPLTDRVM